MEIELHRLCCFVLEDRSEQLAEKNRVLVNRFLFNDYFFHVAVKKKCMSEVTLGREGLLLPHVWLTAQTILMGKAWRQENEAAGHTVSADRKQRAMNAVAQLTSSFLLVLGSKHIGRWHPCPGYVFPPQFNPEVHLLSDSPIRSRLIIKYNRVSVVENI